jgi:hypothetical protein
MIPLFEVFRFLVKQIKPRGKIKKLAMGRNEMDGICLQLVFFYICSKMLELFLGNNRLEPLQL